MQIKSQHFYTSTKQYIARINIDQLNNHLKKMRT
jgi:hypothetical protein